MAIYSVFSALINGVQRQVDLSSNTLLVQALAISNGTCVITSTVTAGGTSYSLFWPNAQGGPSTFLKNDGSGNLSWSTTGTGSVTSVSVVTANGFAGTVANPTTTPAITIQTSVNATLLAGNGTAISAAALAQNDIYVGNASNLPVAVAVSGDATLVSSGALTLATVNSNVGSFGSSTSIPSFTVNAKGLITAASGNVVIAPAGTLSGTTLNSTVVNSSLTSLGIQAQALDMGSHFIHNVTDPASAQDAATKNYVDNAINGLTWKGPVQAFANSNVPLTGGATLIIDGYSVQNGDYVILANQTTAAQNYTYLASGIGTAYTLTQAVGSEASNAIGDAYLVEKGTVYGNSAFQVNQISPNVTFIQFAGPNFYSFTSPLALSGTTVSVGYDNSTIGDNGSNQLYVKNAGITSTQLASASVTAVKLATVTDGITTDQSGSGNTIEVLNAPSLKRTLVAGQSFTANTSYAVRWGITANSETANRVYAADITTSSFDLFYVIGMANSGTSVSAGQNIVVTTMGPFSLSSSDTAFASSTDGEAVFLTASGTFSVTPPSTSGQAVTRIGIVQFRSATNTANIIDVWPVVVGVN